MAQRFAAVVVRLRVAVVVGWVLLTTVVAIALPGLDQSGSGSLGDLVPAGAEAIDAERRSAELFAFPFASRTYVVERDPDGLSAERIATTGRRAAEVNRGELPGLEDAAGAYGLTNAVPDLAFARERGTTAFTALLFDLDLGVGARTGRAERYAEALDAPPGSFVGATGAIPARLDQGRVIKDRLPLVEAVTVLFVLLAVGLYLRSLIAPLVTLLTVAVSYLLSVRLLAVSGDAVGISVPAEIEPVLVALLLGVVTDYALFFMSRFRALVGEGAPGIDAARRTTAELTPIVFACGVAVTAGLGALGVAELGFLRAFGPGMALAIAVGLVVVLTLLPAQMALLGRALSWPTSPRRPPPALAGRSRTERVIRRAVDRPRTTVAAALSVVAVMGSGVAWLEVGNPLIRGLPDDAGARVAYEQLAQGFAPGVVAPTTLIVEGPAITRRRDELAALQAVLSAQPGIAGVVGPATSPAERELGAVLSRNGDAARFVLIPATDPVGATAIRRLANLEVRIGDLAEAVGLDAARTSFAGDTALVAETIDDAGDDLPRVLLAVLVVLSLVLMAFLRGVVMPLALVVLAGLAPLASLGLAVGLFQGLLGQDGLTFFVPVVAAVLLLALGSDYNVFIAGSIRAEARHRPLRDAVVAGGSGAAHAIAAAGIILAGSFAALALVPIAAFVQLAFVLAVGLLLDAFLVRLVLAPAVIVLAERGGRRHARQRSPGG